MIQKSEILNKLKSSKPELNKYGVAKIGLFGSSVRNEANENSDIDIIIDFYSSSETFDNYMNTCNYLENVFLGIKLDIVTEKGLSPFIGPYILKEAEYA
jgi:uncharacterized protein